MISPEEMKNTCLEQFEAIVKPSRVKRYAQAYTYATDVGKTASSVLVRNLTRDVVGSYVPQEYADEVVYSVLEAGYIKTAAAAQKAHRALYLSENIGIDALVGEINNERIVNLCNAIVNAQGWHDINSLLTDSVINFVESGVTDTLERNVNREAELGFQRIIRRYSESGCCKWCSGISGEYNYNAVPDGFYSRHDNCNCQIVPVNFTAKRQWAGNRYAR